MKKVQPEVIEYFCDKCNKKLVGSDKASNCKVVMKSDGLDYSGHAVGPGTGGEFDLCYNCYSDVLSDLKQRIEKGE